MQTLEGFFNEGLVKYTEETLSIANFNTWLEGKPELEFNQVVGFAQPLYLGGADNPDNYQVIDGEVEWEINKQLLKRITTVNAKLDRKTAYRSTGSDHIGLAQGSFWFIGCNR